MAASSSSFAAVVTLAFLLLFAGRANAQLSTNLYSESYQKLLSTVKSSVQSAISKEACMGASLLRLFFLNCLLAYTSSSLGCDGFILLDDTSNFIGEKNAAPNRNSARGFEVIDSIKSAVENVCPGVVSCADILAIAARDSVVAVSTLVSSTVQTVSGEGPNWILGGPNWDVKLGRRDTRTASQAAANTSIPPPTSDLAQTIISLTSIGFSASNIVSLSGARTIGQASCTNFRARIYNETTIDSSFAQTRRSNCPRTTGSGDNNLAPLDIQSTIRVDNDYYKDLIQRKGLLHFDQQLFNGGSTDSIVRTHCNNQSAFYSDFVAAMIKMGDISPLTGSNGEIRKNCRKLN